jgi:hypothetical protein
VPGMNTGLNPDDPAVVAAVLFADAARQALSER